MEVLPVPPAVAETTTSGGGDSDSISKPPPTAEETARGDAKLRAARAWGAAQRGEGSVADYDAAREEYEAQFPGEARLPAFERKDVTPTATFYHLDLWQIGQHQSNWCGPASAAMIIRQMYRAGVIPTERSRDGQNLAWTEANLALPEFLDAVFDGTYRTDMERGLNRWANPPYSYALIGGPSFGEFYDALAFDVNVKEAQEVATNEYANGAHYNGHPNQRIGHWVPAYGYYYSNGTMTDARFADSSTSVWSGPAAYFNYSGRTFAGTFVGDGAIVW
ncbi:hypothetical protein [Flindersiella endophytica]